MPGRPRSRTTTSGGAAPRARAPARRPRRGRLRSRGRARLIAERRRICGSSSTTRTGVGLARVMAHAPGRVIDHRCVPPPGVSSTASSPPIASTKPRATARPRPDPARRSGVAEPLERPEDLLALDRPGCPALVDDAEVDTIAADAGERSGPARSGGDACSAFAMTFATARSSSAASASTRGSVSGTSTTTRSPRRRGSTSARGRPRRGRPRAARARAPRPGGGSCRAGCRRAS